MSMPCYRCPFAVVLLIFVGIAGCSRGVNPRGANQGQAGASTVPVLPSVKSVARGPTVACILIGVEEWSPKVKTEHQLNALKYAVADVRLLKEAFVELGVPPENIFVRLNEDATEEGIDGVFSQVATHVQEQDTMVVAFIGHGMGGSTSDARLIAHDRSVSLRWLLRCLDAFPTHKALLLLDACHSGSTDRPQFLVNAENLARKDGLAWISSASADQSAFEADTLGHGLFTHYLAEVLKNSDQYDRDSDGWLNLEEIGNPVQKSVESWADTADLEQRPEYGSVYWSGSSKLLPVRKKWSLSVRDWVHTATVDISFPTDLDPSDRIWVVVAPRQAPGRYYPQPQAVFKPSQGPTKGATVYLGGEYKHVGQLYTVKLVHADSELHRTFLFAGEDGLMYPPIHTLRVKAEQTDRRR